MRATEKTDKKSEQLENIGYVLSVRLCWGVVIKQGLVVVYCVLKMNSVQLSLT